MMSARHPTVLSAAAWLLLASALHAQSPWAVPEARLRFDFKVESKPSEPSAGILAFLPDGGLLAHPELPRAHVLDDRGRPLEFEYLWHNSQEGLALVLAPPETPGFSVYISRQSRFYPNTRARFTPSLLLYVRQGNASLEAAQRMASAFPPGGRDSVLGLVPNIAHQFNPLGHDDDYSTWYRGWIRIERAGRYYFATVSDEGSSVSINGRTVAEWPGLHTRAAGAKGQFGSAIELTAGLHQVHYFHFEKTGPQESLLVWRLPGATNTLPVHVPAAAFVKSGAAGLTAVRERDNNPLAIPHAPARQYFWFGNRPANLHRLEARLTAQNPADSTYEWRLDDGKIVREPAFDWIFEDSGPRTVTLTVRAGNRASTATCSVRIHTAPPRASINSPAHRVAFRTALLNRCRAVPPPARPAADWSPDLWELLGQIVEPLKGHALLTELFERSREDLLRLDPDKRFPLEDFYVENLRYADTNSAALWIDRLEREERNLDRKHEWSLARIELLLHHVGDTNAARQAAQALFAQAPGAVGGVLALVRLGDIAALGGRVDEARGFYARAQEQTPRRTTPASGAGTASAGLARSRDELERRRAETAGSSGLARSRDELAAARGAPASGRPGAARSPFARPVEAWKAETVRGGAYYETVRSLIAAGYLVEARAALRDWELELPMEKLGGDYPVAEAELYMSIQDFNRARAILQTYRQAVDMSAFLPKVMGMELQCLSRLNRTDDRRALAVDIVRRFPGHPLAEEARRHLAVLGPQAPSPLKASPRVEL